MNLHQQQLSALNCCSYKELGQQIFLPFGNVLCCIAIYFSYPLQVYIISVAFYFVYWERGQLMRLFLQGESVWLISLKHSTVLLWDQNFLPSCLISANCPSPLFVENLGTRMLWLVPGPRSFMHTVQCQVQYFSILSTTLGR